MLSQAFRTLRPLALTLACSAVLFAGRLQAQTASAVAASGSHPVADRLTQPIDENTRVTLHGTVHPLANKANDRGAVSDGMKLDRIQVVLKRSAAQETALQQLISQLHTPGSASYHKWLTPDDFGKQFGPSDSDVAKVESWLGSHGFSVTKLNPGRQTIEIAGSAGQFRDTFHTQIHSYQVKGETRFANASDPEIPAALAPVFGGFASLNNFRLKSYSKVLGKSQFNPVTHEVKPEWTTGDSSGVFFYLAPGDFAVQYDLNPLYTAATPINGTGQSIAVVNESNINIAEVNRYRSLFGLPVNPPQVVIDGNDPGIDGINSPYGPNFASGEAYLDVELSGSVAPDAQINLVIADDTALESGLTLAAERAVYSNISPVLSLSFGGCEAAQGTGNAFFSALWEQAAAQGITVVVSSGDSGSAGCDDSSQAFAVFGQAVNGLASTPYDVAVGGTDFYYSTYNGTSAAQNAQISGYWVTTPNNSTPMVTIKGVIPEQPWNNSQYGLDLANYYNYFGTTTIGGAGGGASTAGLQNSTTNVIGPYPKPSWQAGPGVPADGVRDLPDVSLFAANGDNYTTYPICAGDGDCEPASTVQISGIGGTSASVQAFAGIMALVNQKYGRQGQANYVLYPLAKQFPSAFHDVTVGTNSVPCATANVSDGEHIYAPTDCISVTNPITATDQTYGTVLEGEIGHAAGTPAYNATAGYDLASGLGTIDAANLVTNWGSVALGATTTTLTPSSTSFAHGTAVTISGTVSGASPTGSVALVTTSSTPNNQGETIFPLTSGAYTGSVNYLPGGTYDISGYYSGDGSNAASSSTPTQITVTPEASTTALTVYSSLTTSSGTPLPATGGTTSYGQPVVLSAVPAGVTSAGNSTVPTGSVVFSDGATVINTAVVNVEGDAEYNDAPAPGSHTITAKYSGDASYGGSTSSAISFTVAKNTPAGSVLVTNIYDNENHAAAGQTTYLAVQLENSASANNVGVAPTGTVTLTGAPSGTPTSATLVPANDPGTYVPDGTAYFAIPSTATGSYNISFSYAGDANYNATTFSQQVNLVAQTGLASTTTANATAMSTSPAAAVQVTVTVAGLSGHAAPTGTVYLFSQDYIITSRALPTSTGTSATLTFDFDSGSLPQGTNQFVVQYSGDTLYNSSATTFTVTNPLSDFSLIPATTILQVPATGSSAGIQSDVINLSSNNGFAGAVALTCSGAGGVTCSLGSNSLTLASGGSASTTLTVNAGAITKGGTYSVLVTGTDPTGNVIHTIGLQVVTPSYTLTGPAITIPAPGDVGTSTITTSSLNSFAGTVTLTCAVTAPAGATGTPTCALSPATAAITGAAAATSTLTVTTSGTTTPGSYSVTLTGTSGSITQTGTVPFTVGGFTLSAATPVTFTAGNSGTSTVTATPTNGFTGSVALTCSVTGPSGATSVPTCALSPASASITGAAATTSTLTITSTATTTTGNYTVSVTGTSAQLSVSTSVAVTVNAVVTAPGTFTVSNSGAITIATQGGTGTSTISVTPSASNGYTGAVSLTCAVTTSPSGASEIPTCSLSPTSVTLAGSALTSTLTVNTTAQTTSRLDLPLKRGLTLGGGIAMAALLFFGIPMGRRGRKALGAVKTLRILSLALFFAVIAGAAIGCGGGSSSSGGGGGLTGGTTTGTYTITITATPAAGTAQTTTVSVTVN